MRRVVKKEYVGFRTTKASKERLTKLALKLGYRNLSEYLSDFTEAPLKPEHLDSLITRFKSALQPIQ